MKKTCFYFLIFLVVTSVYSQAGFRFLDVSKKEQTVRFQLVNNLIIIPLTINGKQLNFILDTGVNKTILFNLNQNDSLSLNNVEKISLQGLGSGGKKVEALVSKQNTIRIQNFISTTEDIYVILKDKFDISGRMGVTVHGIIGYNLLKNTLVKINYRRKKIYFYNPKLYKKRKCRRCTVFPLQFYRNKPYINAQVQLDTIGNTQTDVKLLIDTGGTEAVWLFENSKKEIQTPKRFFRDVLGEGLSGTIYGNKSRIKAITFGRFTIRKPTASFLDSASTYYARRFKARNGSIGGNILKRFKLWIDYPNQQITLKKNGSFRGGFQYNMSGIHVVYNGQVLIKEKEIESSNVGQYHLNNNTRKLNTVSLITRYLYRFKPSYKIDAVVKDSPADLAGLLKGDVLLEINGVKVHNYTMEQLVAKFQEKPNKKMRIKVERLGKQLTFEFHLIKKI